MPEPTPEETAAAEAAAQAEAAAAEQAAREAAENNDDPATWDPERAKRTILAQRAEEVRLRGEAAAEKARAEALQAQADELAQIKAAQLTEQERAQQEAEAAKAEAATAKQALRRGYLLAELAKPEHGLVDAEAAAALIEGVEYGEDGKPTNTTERIAGLLETKAFLKAPLAPVAAPSIDPGGGATPAPGPALTAEELEAAQEHGLTGPKYAALREVRTLADYEAATKALEATTQ